MKTMATNLDLRKQEIEEICLDSSETSLAEQPEKPRQKRLAWHIDRLSRTKEVVLLDPKDYGNNPDDDTGSKVYERVKELARMLHEFEPAASDESGPRTLKCKGWYEDQATAQFYFVYRLPAECEVPSGDTEFRSLSKLYKTSTPSIGARIRLARSLAMTLLRVHEQNWLHKGIRSDHVLFFPRKAGGRPSLDYPRLVGFDYARRDGLNEYSEKPL
jgi:hypothetical protein